AASAPSAASAPRADQPGHQNSTAPAMTRADVDAWLDEVVPAALDSADVAGAGVAVVHDGQVLTTRGFGAADTGDGRAPVPVDPKDTLFRVGSVSKLFTATAVMQLVEAGRVDLDTEVEEYVDIDVPRRVDRPITLRHLLTHTAGFEERLRGLIGTPGTDVDLRAALVTDPPEQVFAPGTMPAYSNYGNALAGYVVEQVSGRPFEDYVADDVLARAGMASSSFAQPLPPALAGRLSKGYSSTGAPAEPFEMVSTPPAGALSSSTDDMARFMLAQLGEPVPGVAAGSPPVLRPETLDLMQRPALGEDTLGALAAGPRMGLGYFDEDRNGREVVGHGGDTSWFHAHLQLYPQERTGIFVALNSSGSTPTATLDLRQRLLAGFADRYFPESGRPSPSVDADTAREHAAAMEGRYEPSRTFRSTFATVAGLMGRTTVTAQDDGRLLFSPGPATAEPAVYEEVRPWVWREVDGDRTVAARVSDGRVEAIGFESAFALLPVPVQRSEALVLPVLVGSAAVLVVGGLCWLLARPVLAVRRRRRGARTSDRNGRTLRVLSRLGVACAALAIVGWAGILTTMVGLTDVPEIAIRAVQALQLLGALAVVPAALRLVDEVRRRVRWWRVASTATVLAALVGLAWFAVEFRLLAPSVSY
ncbi:MAG: serine hydrolase, partial [Dermatophilaceae bacterium]